MDIRIIVATHKKYWIPDDDVYLPLHVGKALHTENFGYIGDNTGDNISEKNFNYCELTGLYWAWKNLSCKYIGLCHYRRYFARQVAGSGLQAKKAGIFARDDYEKLLQKYDAILPHKRNYYIETVRSQYAHAHRGQDLQAAGEIIAEMHPEYSEAFRRVMASTKLYIFNMFVLKKTDFDEYCAWLFSILQELEKRADISAYNHYQARVFGFLGERLFNVWLTRQQLKVAEAATVNLERVNWTKKIALFLKRKIRGTF